MKFLNPFLFLRICLSRKTCEFSSACMYRNYSVKSELKERIVLVKTCGNIYENWKKQNLFRKVPDGDLEFKVPYIDTRVNSSTSLPILLALHGAPGSWRDFELLASYFSNLGYRVIAPSFPDFLVYRPGIFRHSDIEKAQYTKDFLKEISVSNVDLLICHSGATYPGLILCLNNNPKIKSLALLNPATFNTRTINATKNFTGLQIMIKASENPVLLKFMEICGPFILKKIMKVPVRFESVLDPLLSATCIVHGNAIGSKDKFLQLVSKKLPILFAFSELDPLMGTESSYELAALLGAQVSDIFIYGKEGTLIHKGTAKPALKVMAFQEGSHYVFLKHPAIIHTELETFLKSQQ